MSKIFNVLKGCKTLIEAPLVMRNLFILFGKLVLQIFSTILREVLTGNGFHGCDSHTTLTFVRKGYVAGGCISSLDHYDMKRRCTMKPDEGSKKNCKKYSVRASLV